MPSVQMVLAFAVAAVLFTISPGPSNVYIVTRSLTQGRGAGLVSMAGFAAGVAVQVVAAAVGLSALLASSATWFAVVKYLGAAYLIVLGIRTLLTSREHGATRPPRPQPLTRICWQGFVVTVLNPKLGLFMLALLPQFVDPARGSPALQIAVLGAVLILVGAASDLCYTLLASTVGNRLRRSTRAMRRSRLASGIVYIALGIFAAVAGHRPQTA
ncbi:MAG: LysE family translocator [Streptosporangiaceae bacterium]